MSAIQHLLERWGFVKLDRYGLVLTPERRILSTRPAVLEDGAGGRIVGWHDQDHAVSALPAWPSERAEPVQPVAQRVVTQAAAPATRIERLVITEASILAQVPPDASAAVMAVDVAPERVVDEDEWEWTIALAKARAAEPPSEVLRNPPPRAAVHAARREPAASEPPRAPRTAARSMPAAAPRQAVESARTERMGAVGDELRAGPSAPAPTTVIPVPALPSMQGTSPASRLAPVVRTASDPSQASRRLGKGTAPVGQTAVTEDTIPNLSIGDRTRPGIGLPEVARAVELPSIKRRMAARG